MSNRLNKITDWESLAQAAKFEPGSMAALCPVSLRQLERHFQDEFGKSPRRWAQELRCRLARELIQRGYSNKAVVEELHFASESHFCHQFKRIHGRPPQSFAPLRVSGPRVEVIPSMASMMSVAAMSPSDKKVALEQSSAIANVRKNSYSSYRSERSC